MVLHVAQSDILCGWSNWNSSLRRYGTEPHLRKSAGTWTFEVHLWSYWTRSKSSRVTAVRAVGGHNALPLVVAGPGSINSLKITWSTGTGTVTVTVTLRPPFPPKDVSPPPTQVLALLLLVSLVMNLGSTFRVSTSWSCSQYGPTSTISRCKAMKHSWPNSTT